MHVGAVSVPLCCFIDRVVLVPHLWDVHRLRAVIDGSVVPYVALQRGSGCQHVVLSPADSSQRGAEPPAGAICIPDKAIHHPHCGAQFRAPLQTASGSSEQLYMYVSVMRALETCLVALWASLEGWRESMSRSSGLIPRPSSRLVPNMFSFFFFWMSPCGDAKLREENMISVYSNIQLRLPGQWLSNRGRYRVV